MWRCQAHGWVLYLPEVTHGSTNESITCWLYFGGCILDLPERTHGSTNESITCCLNFGDGQQVHAVKRTAQELTQSDTAAVCCLQVDLPSLPRRKLEAQRLHYCTAQERTAYAAAVNSQVSPCPEAYPAGCAQDECNVCTHRL